MIAYLIYNIFNLGCFTTLAIVFDRWWIIFFALLFIILPSTKVKYSRTCDNCGVKSEAADSAEEAIQKAINNGWIHIPKSNEDYCPHCAKNLKVCA